MKKLFAAFILLCHMNTSMFLPQSPEDDQYDANGQQIDDINSVTEYIAVLLGYDHTPDDEDDDSGQNFHMVKSFDYDFNQHFTLIKPVSEDNKKTEFPEYINARIENISPDVITPPPRC